MVRAGGLHGVPEQLEALGLDADKMLTRYRIPLHFREDDELLISLDAYAELLEECVLLTGCLDLGMRVAQAQDINILGPLSIAMQNSASVSEALKICSRFLHMQSPAFVLEIRDGSAARSALAELRFEVILSGKRHMPQLYEQSIADLHLILKFLIGKNYILQALKLPHALRAPVSQYRQVFGDARIEAAQDCGGLVIAREYLDIPLGLQNQTLKQMSMDYLRMAYDSPAQTVEDQVRNVLRRALSSTQGRKQAVADLLYLHPRTLQRRLQAEKTSFEAIRVDEQKRAVLRYLRQTRIPLAHVAALAGFSEQSVLTRACRQWFGMTPSAIRKVGQLDG